MYLHPLISKVSQEDRAALVRRIETRSYRRNEVLIRADEWTDCAYCVGSGLLRTVVQGSGDRDEVTTDFVSQDDFFLSLPVGGEKYQTGATLVAALPSSVYLVPVQALRELCCKYPHVALGLLELVLKRTTLLRGQLRRVATSSSEKLITRALHELTKIAPVGKDGYDKRITQSVIASYSGLSREQVNKTMRDLENRGLVKKQDDGVHVPPGFASTDFQEPPAMQDISVPRVPFGQP